MIKTKKAISGRNISRQREESGQASDFYFDVLQITPGALRSSANYLSPADTGRKVVTCSPASDPFTGSRLPPSGGAILGTEAEGKLGKSSCQSVVLG